MKRLLSVSWVVIFFAVALVSSAASAGSLSCFDDMSFGTGKWVKINLRQLSSGKYDYSIEWSTGATVVAKSLECRLAVIGTSPVIVEGSCEKSTQKLDFRPGTYNGTMTIVQNLSKTVGNAFRCERVKQFAEYSSED